MNLNFIAKSFKQVFRNEKSSAVDSLASRVNTDYLKSDLRFGSSVFYGFMDIMPNPDPVLKKMGSGYDVSIYKDLLADPQLYGAIENNRKPGVTALLRYLDNEKCPDDEREFFHNFFEQLDEQGIYNNITNLTLDTPQYGRTTFGLQWGVVDGRFVPVKIGLVPFDEYVFNKDGELLVLSEYGGSYEKPKHPARYLVLQHKATLDNPYGEPLLSKCYWNIRFKKDGLKLWALFTEKYGMPWVNARYNPATLSNIFNIRPDAAANILYEQLATMAKDGIIVFPDGTQVDVLSSGKSDNALIYEKMVRICDEQNTKLQLGHSGATESTSGDKLSNDTTATDVRQNVIDADKMYPIMFWNKVIKWIHTFNFTGDEKPRFDLYAKDDVDMQWADRDSKLVSVLSLAGLKPTLEYFKKTYGFEDEDLTTADSPFFNLNNARQSDKQQFDQAKTLAQAFIHNYFNKKEAENDFPDQNIIDEQVDKAAASDIFEKAIISFVEINFDKYKSYEEAEKGLPKLLSELNTQEFEEFLTQMLFASDIIGRLSVKDEGQDE